MAKPRIGFIGLGLMGSAMVERLQAKGYPVAVLGHRNRAGIEAAVKRGANEAASAKQLAEGSDIVMFCMGTSEQVETRVYGDDGVLAGVRPGQIVIDFGTSLPGSTKKIGADMMERGAVYMDAPLGRTPAHARDGLLNIMCAGDAAAYSEIRPVLDDLGENVFHLGPLGTGHTIKLINNFFGMTVACAMSEAFAMADAAGVPRDKLYDAMSAGPLRSGMMDFVRNYSAEGKIDLAFTVDNAVKDVGYYRSMAEELGVRSRMSSAANDTLVEAKMNGFGEKMVPQLVDYLAEHLAD
ncbi:NAD(P)-dependent oxidoreductase [Ostreiculturibacter nitratireducens]|uniref:NAD(P)-dependent oxidoreductase n=1 Tax=Ostreiculturibacter nitratireducens TaxID=3075226 RepID=UPI0031B60E0D